MVKHFPIWVFTFITFFSYSQVKNQFIDPSKSKDYGIFPSIASTIGEFNLPTINVKSLLKEDSLSRNQGVPFRFGKDVDVNINFIKVATKYENQDTTVYVHKINSKNAFSINLIFDEFFLAKNASLIIYNSEKTMLYGPLTYENNPLNSSFWTDLIKGESIILQLNVVGRNTNETRLRISKVVHGYQNTYAGFGQSAACHRDIACPDGNDWRNEANSVAMLLLANGTRFCSGALLNNACQDFTPNFLTAFHCLDLSGNGVLENAERNAVNNWVFRFLYESPNCGGPDGTAFVSVNGSTFRSAFQQSDFALLLLNSRPTGNVRYAGWSRATVAATSSVGIHHPNGDVKKISTENNQATTNANTINWVGGTTSPPNTHWRVVFDQGGSQPGSSGSPLFNQEHRIVGQLHGGAGFCPGEANFQSFYGRFDVSWNGGGTPDTQLSTWLTNDPNVTQTNTVQFPGLTSNTSLVCSTANLTLINQPPNTTLSWTTNVPNGLSVNGSGQVTRLNNYDGIVMVTSWINGTGFCTNSHTAISAPLWVGRPVSTVSGVSNPYPGQLYTYTTIDPNLNGAGSYNWVVSGGTIYGGGGPSSTSVTVFWNEAGFVELTSENSCGISTYTLFVTPDTGGGCDPCQRKRTEDNTGNPIDESLEEENILGIMVAYPNPSEDIFTVRLNNELKISKPISITIFDINGQPIKFLSTDKKKFTISLREYPTGLYYLRADIPDKRAFVKLIRK